MLANSGPLLEQWVGVELSKRLACRGRGSLAHFRTTAGVEVDFVVQDGTRPTPIEVKWTDNLSRDDARNLLGFLAEQGSRAPTSLPLPP